MRLIKVTRGGVGIKYTDAKGNARHALKTAEDKPFECDDAQAERLVGLDVAEYVDELDCEEEANAPQNVDEGDAQNDAQNGDGDGSEDGKSDDRLTAEALEKWDYNDIKALAADMGVNPEGKKKGDYINAILSAQAEAETDEDDEDGLPNLSAADPE